MKWRGRILFLLLSFSFVTAARSQLISFSVNNESLGKVFLLIEQQSGHHFIYSTEELSKAKPVTLAVTNEQLTAVLDKCFAGQPLQYSLHEKNITVKEKPVATASRSLQGRVVNEQGEPVAGITIGIKNSSLQTASDQVGLFKLENVPAAVVLLVSGAEMEPLEISVGSETFVQITIRGRVGTLDETYIIAYGKSSRRYATGTVSSLKAEEISKHPVSNVLSALTARIPGLQVTQFSGVPGAHMRLQLRGINSIANGNDPLIVIDGVPFPAQPLNGSLSGGAGVSGSPLNSLNPSDIESVEVLKDADATAIYGSRGANGVILITTKKAKGAGTTGSIRLTHGIGKVTRKLNLLNSTEYLAMRREAFAGDGLTLTMANARDLLRWDTTRYTDWQEELIGHTMTTTDAQASFSAGTERTQMLLNAGYHRETTVFPDDFGEQRKSLLLTAAHRSDNRRFSIAVTAAYSHYRSVLPQQDLLSAIMLPPVAPAIYQPDGKLNWENSTWSNPLARTKATFTTTTENVNANLLLSWELVRGLQLRLAAGATTLRTQDHTPTPEGATNPAFGNQRSAGFGDKTIQTVISEPQIEYSGKWGKHTASLLIGATVQQTTQQAIYQMGTGYTSDALLGSLSAASGVATLSETDSRYRYEGTFARLKYTYDKRYLVSLTARRDGSSRYGEQNRFASFGSAALAWLFSEEPFLRTGWLSFGKLKGSVGVTGNDQIGDYRYLKLYSPASYPYLGIIPYYPVQHHNPLFSWEKVTKLEAGLDLGLMKDRLLVGVNYYHNTTRNQLVSYPLPAVTGFDGVLQNVPATIRNTGWEFDLTVAAVNRPAFSWKITANWTIPSSKLLAFDGLSTSAYASRYVIGQPLGIAKTYQFTGVDPVTGVYTFSDRNSDGQLSSLDRDRVLVTAQQGFGGLQNMLTMGRLSISCLLQGVLRQHTPGYLSLFSKPGGMQNQPHYVLDRWQTPRDISPIQRFSVSQSAPNTAYTRYQQSDAAYSKGSFLRLRNLAVAWQWRKTVATKVKTPGATLFIEGHNLFTITGYDGLDPENSIQLLPPLRMIVAGCQFTF